MEKRRKTWRDNHGNLMEGTLEGASITIRNLTDGTVVPPFKQTEEEAQDFFEQLPGTEQP